MMVEIHLYGKLRRHIKGTTGIQDNILTLTPKLDEMIPGVEIEGAPLLIDLLNEYQALTF